MRCCTSLHALGTRADRHYSLCRALQRQHQLARTAELGNRSRGPRVGDRRDHFESLKDVWEMFRIVAEQRKRREIDPTLGILQECLGELEKAGTDAKYTRERLEEMLSFLTATTGLFEELIQMPTAALKGITRIRGRLRSVIGIGRK